AGRGQIPTLLRIGNGLALLWKGEIEAGAALAEEAIEGAMLAGNSQFLTWALWVRCWGATLAGEGPEAVRLGEEAARTAGSDPDPVSALAGCHLAEALLDSGRPDRCRELIPGTAGGDGLSLVERAFRSRWYEVLTRAALAEDDLD